MRVLRISGAGALCAFALAACHSNAPTQPADAPRSVRVAPVEDRALTGGLTASGLLVSREEAAVSAEQLLAGYRVLKVYVEAGATVKQGQPLAQLDDTLLRSQIAQSAALVEQQKVAAAQADEQAKDVQGLDKQGVLSTEAIDQRRFQAQSARATVNAQTAALQDLQAREAKMTVRAPVSGLILTRNIRPGDQAGGGTTPMFTMARDSLIELYAQVAEGDVTGLKVGDTVKVTFADGSTADGAVRLIEPYVDPQTKLVKVHVSLPVRADIRAGGFGRAEFTGLTRTVLAVPETAIRYDADGPSVMVVGADNRVSQVPIRTGAHEGGYVELLQGPPAGARVLLGGAAFVLPGDTVKPVTDASAS